MSIHEPVGTRRCVGRGAVKLAAACAIAVLLGHAIAPEPPAAHAQGRAPVVPALGALGVHVVRPGETLFGIASRYGMTPGALARLNGTTADSVLWAGRQLWVPLDHAVNARADQPAGTPSWTTASGILRSRDTGFRAATPGAGPGTSPAAADASASGSGAPGPTPEGASASTAGGTETTYTVVPGDTLFAISRRFASSVEDLKRWNGLPPDGSVRAGDTLIVSGGRSDAVVTAAGQSGAAAGQSGGRATRDAYTVGAGDTLAGIAARFGTTVGALKTENGLAGELIRSGQTLVVPRAGVGPVSAGGARRIEIDIGEQHMYVWQGDTLIWSWVVSTGMAGYPTRRGSFAVQSRIPNAWSGPWQLWMPHWLGIYWAGGSENGIHALPIINGQRLWGGLLGTPISYGCVVLGIQEAELLYNWAEIGTPVEIHD